MIARDEGISKTGKLISRRRWLFVLSALIFGAALWPTSQIWGAGASASGPKTIYILRHGEKTDSKEDAGLSPKGVERAKALVHVIPEHFCMPDVIVATAKTKHSERPLDTIRPLAESLHMNIVDSYADDDVQHLAHDLLTEPRYSGKTILICWHHGQIPNLAKALGVTNAPDKWPGEVFDRVWKLTYAANGVKFENLPQRALPGDSEK